MLLKPSLQNAKSFFQNTFQGFKSLLHGGFSFQPAKALAFNPLSCIKPIPHSDLMNRRIYAWKPTKSNHQEHAKEVSMKQIIVQQKEPIKVDDTAPNNTCERLDRAASDGALIEMKDEMWRKISLPKTGSYQEKKRQENTSQIANGRANNCLAQKMKALEMLDMGDVDHSQDVLEALHCYSSLTSPVYLDIVDKFFMDMYTDFYVPQKPISPSSSSRRLNSSRRLSSSRRLGPIQTL